MEGILAPWHWIVLIVVVMLVFGPKKLPELGRSLGKGISGFKSGLKDMQDEFSASMAESGSETAAPTTASVATVEATPAEATPATLPVAASTTAEPAVSDPISVAAQSGEQQAGQQEAQL